MGLPKGWLRRQQVTAQDEDGAMACLSNASAVGCREGDAEDTMRAARHQVTLKLAEDCRC